MEVVQTEASTSKVELTDAELDLVGGGNSGSGTNTDIKGSNE